MSIRTSKLTQNNSLTIMGIDILPGFSSLTKAKSKYALAILKQGSFIELNPSLTMRGILYLIRKYKPHIVAVDNIFEIIPNTRNIYSFMVKLPSETKLVQVTGSPYHKMHSISQLAEQINYHLKGKPTPIETAKLIAFLANKRIGTEIVAFENETMITVSRTRSIGPGGWSQARLRRRLHSFILNQTREIEDILKKNGLEYELMTRESDFGLDQSKFIVNANRNQLKKIIKELKGPDIRVTITPIKKSTLLYLPLDEEISGITSSGKRLIVGIDPGITTGLAILNLNGELLALKSTKSFSKSRIISYIYRFGEPLIIASDTVPPSNFVIKLAKITRSKLFSPSKLMTVSEKKEIVSGYVTENHIKLSGSHQRDALAAAIKAFKFYEPLFRKVDMKLRNIPQYVPSSKIKADIVLNEKSISQAIHEYIIKHKNKKIIKSKPSIPTQSQELTEEQLTIRKLRKQIHNLTEYNEQLKLELTESKNKISELEQEFKNALSKQAFKLKRERLIQLKDEEIKKLKQQISILQHDINALKQDFSKLKKIKILEAKGEIIPVKIVKTFSKDSLKETEDKYGLLPNDILYIYDAGGGGKSTAELIITKGIKAIITGNEMSHLAMSTLVNAEIPVIPKSIVDLRRYYEFYAVDRSKFEVIYDNFISKIKEKKETEKLKKMQQIIEEYQTKRKEEFFNTNTVQR
ncbi:MAG: DUF460 domain-containing protein [Candidatus Odinarchaeia archaeon]